MENDVQYIRNEDSMYRLLSRMPKNVSDSFTDEQLTHLKVALCARKWGKHKVDFRGTFAIPFIPHRYYFVFLLGKNFRQLSRKEKLFSAYLITLFTSLFILFSTLLGLLVLYLIKSALGINLFDNFSLGIWGWFKAWIQ